MADPLMVRSEGLKPAFFFFFFFQQCHVQGCHYRMISMRKWQKRLRGPQRGDSRLTFSIIGADSSCQFPTSFFCLCFILLLLFFFKFYLCMNQRGEHSERVRHFQNCHLVPNCFLLVFQEQKRNEIMKASLKIDVAEDELSSQSE